MTISSVILLGGCYYTRMTALLVPVLLNLFDDSSWWMLLYSNEGSSCTCLLKFLCLCYLTQSGWLKELQALGYKNPLPTPAHVGIQVVIATIEPSEIHRFIQEHDL